MNIVHFEPQPRFPMRDISEDTAEELALYLSNRDVLTQTHSEAEAINKLYQLSHTALAAVAKSQLDNPANFLAFSHGVTIYEAMASMVRPQPPQVDRNLGQLNIVLTANRLFHEFNGTLSRAKGELDHNLPHTAWALGQIATRSHRSYVQSAVIGAAMARELEIRTTAA